MDEIEHKVIESEMKKFAEDLDNRSRYLWTTCQVIKGDVDFWMRGTMNDKIFSRNLVCGLYVFEDKLTEIMKLIRDKGWFLEDWESSQKYVS